MAASYPNSVKSFTTKVDGVGQKISASHVNDLQDEVTAIEQDILANGLTLTSGAVKFPATQVPSSGANDLDDYEEGTWTPTITGSISASGQAYSAQSGTYTKVGRKVTVIGRVTLSTLGTITGTVEIGNLPFPCAASGWSPLQIGQWASLGASFVWVGGFVQAGQSAIAFVGAKAAAANTAALTQTDLTATSDFIFAAVYFV